jgi:uncharacterized DUF497 family protein
VFSWDTTRAIRKQEKDKVSFDEAATIFADPEALDWEDMRHSEREERRKRLGLSIAVRVLLVVDTSRRLKNGAETIRIISARQASRKERKAYSGQPD